MKAFKFIQICFPLICFLTFANSVGYAGTSKTDGQQNLGNIAKAIQGKISLEKYKHSDWIILAKDLTDNKIIYQYNQNSMVNPASLTKLFSVAAALHYLGYDYRFKTPVYFIGKKDG